MLEPVNEGVLGLVGGLGVPAATHYYRSMVAALERRGVEPGIVMVHAHMRRGLAYLERGDLDSLASYLAGLIGRMAAAGATVAAIPAVTPHVCAAELERITPIPFVNILDAVAAEVEMRGWKRVALFGTRYTIESRMFGKLPEVDVVSPSASEIDAIHATYLQLANGQGEPGEHHRVLRALAHELRRRESLDAILLAGTDLSLAFNESNTDFPHLDCAGVHLAAIEQALYPV